MTLMSDINDVVREKDAEAAATAVEKIEQESLPDQGKSIADYISDAKNKE